MPTSRPTVCWRIHVSLIGPPHWWNERCSSDSDHGAIGIPDLYISMTVGLSTWLFCSRTIHIIIYIESCIVIACIHTRCVYSLLSVSTAVDGVQYMYLFWDCSGRVHLTPTITLADLPHIIPALRLQQSRLDFLCDVSQIPRRNPFLPSLEHIMSVFPKMEAEIVQSEAVLTEFVQRLSSTVRIC